MKSIGHPVNAEQHEHMRKRQAQNRGKTFSNVNENWMSEKLTATRFRWTRQAQEFDASRDEYNFRRSAIVVLRVKNQCEQDALRALQIISQLKSWGSRRIETFAASKEVMNTDESRSLLTEYLQRFQ